MSLKKGNDRDSYLLFVEPKEGLLSKLPQHLKGLAEKEVIRIDDYFWHMIIIYFCSSTFSDVTVVFAFLPFSEVDEGVEGLDVVTLLALGAGETVSIEALVTVEHGAAAVVSMTVEADRPEDVEEVIS